MAPAMSVPRKGRLLSHRRPRPRRNLLDEMLPRLQAADERAADEQLVCEMMETSLKLLRDRTRLGDVKLLNAALRELRYAFKVFAPYARLRKVSVFGSARTPQDAFGTSDRGSSRAGRAVCVDPAPASRGPTRRRARGDGPG